MDVDDCKVWPNELQFLTGLVSDLCMFWGASIEYPIWLELLDGLACKVTVYVFVHGGFVWKRRDVVEDA